MLQPRITSNTEKFDYQRPKNEEFTQGSYPFNNGQATPFVVWPSDSTASQQNELILSASGQGHAKDSTQWNVHSGQPPLMANISKITFTNVSTITVSGEPPKDYDEDDVTTSTLVANQSSDAERTGGPTLVWTTAGIGGTNETTWQGPAGNGARQGGNGGNARYAWDLERERGGEVFAAMGTEVKVTTHLATNGIGANYQNDKKVKDTMDLFIAKISVKWMTMK